MSFGVFDYFKEKDIFYLDPAVYINNQLYYFNQKYITENILYSWYYADSVEQKPEDETVEDDISKENAYTWVKAPRYAGKPVEVGPLARMWLSGEYKRGISAMDRYIARVLEVGKIIGILEGILQRVALGPAKQDKYQFLGDIMGTGLIDTTRGALGHWIRLKDGKIFNYEIITPTAWNLSPMDSKGQKGIAEQALIGTTIRDIDNPVELGRIVRSFDPCISCATHITGDNHKTIKMSIV
jgi:hydrogenase large subunit